MSSVDKIVSKRISQARKEARLSQQELASYIGVSDKSISAYEKGRALPPFSKLKKISQVTHYPINYFTDDDPDQALVEKKISTIEKELKEVKKLLKRKY